MKRKIIIGIHGLDNKPPAWLLKRWWKKSIREGLRNAKHGRFFLKFKSVYWADILHPKPESVFVFDEKNPLYLSEPYTKGSSIRSVKRFRNFKLKVLDKVEAVADTLFLRKRSFINIDAVADKIIGKLFSDLDSYYNSNTAGIGGVRGEICNRLGKILRKYQKHEIMLIAHSMGSIISYDVLSHNPDLHVDAFVTIGSPLGMPFVIKKIMNDKGIAPGKGVLIDTPSNIKTSWNNFADPDDKVAVIYRLANNYKANAAGIKPADVVVENDYIYKGKKNPHKLYGYLRTPEISEVINGFLSR